MRALFRQHGIRIDRTERVANSLGNLAGVATRLRALPAGVKVEVRVSGYGVRFRFWGQRARLWSQGVPGAGSSAGPSGCAARSTSNRISLLLRLPLVMG